MPTSFSRTTRSLSNDTSGYALLSWLLAGLFLGAWLLWFFFAEITVYEVSGNARLEVERTVKSHTTNVNPFTEFARRTWNTSAVSSKRQGLSDL